MKKYCLTFFCSLFIINIATAKQLCTVSKGDSLKTLSLDEVTITSSPKESSLINELPITSSAFNLNSINQKGIQSINDLAANTPSLFIPKYGSKLTNAVYIRGIGSRMNTPGVGLYLDDMAMIDKSTYNINFDDIERIEVLRGPQSTLYGRNAVGGLIKLYSKDPLKYQGTDIKLGAATHQSYKGSINHYQKVSNKFAFSVGAYYKYCDGFFNNTLLNKKADRKNETGARFKANWFVRKNLELKLNVSYEYDDEGAYPYSESDGKSFSQIETNYPNNYTRNLFNNSLALKWNTNKFLFTAVTGYQHLKDRMFMDQDFGKANMFTVSQRQNMNNYTEEITIRDNNNKKWNWVTGAFGFYQSLNTLSPVTFREGGMRMIQGVMNQAMTHAPVSVVLEDKELPIHGDYSTPNYGLAVFHQSTFNDLLGINNLSATLGVRFNYEKSKIEHQTDATLNAKIQFKNSGASMNQPREYNIKGKDNFDHFDFLPKFALNYKFNKQQIYGSITKGIRSGGYNIQMFSDILQSSMMSGQGTDNIDIEEVNKLISYKPETTWSYEVGSHLSFLDNKLRVNAAAYLMQTKDQQIAKFAKSGFGRQMINAGRSRSLGVELSTSAEITSRLSANLNYGYTNAKFTNYKTNIELPNKETQEVDYKGNYVPFAPQHTLSVGATYHFNCNFFDEIYLTVNYSAAGPIYWNESNKTKRDFVGTLNSQLTIQKGIFTIDGWINNILNTSYATFYFESMNKGFAERSLPIQAGINVSIKL